MTVQQGKKAPDFAATTDSGELIRLSALRGKPVILYFYPKDDTSGCTSEACDFRDGLAAFIRIGAQVLGISRDSVASHVEFEKKHDLDFPLVSDTDGAISDQYGTWVEKSMYGRKYLGMERATYLIDAAAIVRRIWRKVKVAGHVGEVLQATKEL